MRANSASLRKGTPQDLVDAARMRDRIVIRKYRGEDLDGVAILRKVIEDFTSILQEELHDDYGRETLMAAAQRAIDEVLAEPSARHAAWDRS